MKNILISSCLLGNRVRYDGGDKFLSSALLDIWRKEGRLIAVCPELSGGFSVPRNAAEIRGGDGSAVLDGAARVIDNQGRDVTDQFIAGARITLQVALDNDCSVAILTENSPSCGASLIYDGSFSGRRRAGVGVTTALLERHGLKVYASQDFHLRAKELSHDLTQ